jgi:hypothetical protein
MKKNTEDNLKTNLPVSDQSDEIVVPKLKYKYVPVVENEVKMKGAVLPMPVAAMEYLNSIELKLFYLIMRMEKEHTACYLDTGEIAVILDSSRGTVYNVCNRLGRMGVITERKKRGVLVRNINYKIMQILSDMSAKWKAGALIALRKMSYDTFIPDIPKETVAAVNANFRVTGDPIEDETYK